MRRFAIRSGRWTEYSFEPLGPVSLPAVALATGQSAGQLAHGLDRTMDHVWMAASVAGVGWPAWDGSGVPGRAAHQPPIRPDVGLATGIGIGQVTRTSHDANVTEVNDGAACTVPHSCL